MARRFDEASLAELVVKDAKDLAQSVATKDESTKSQMRRFYQEYIRIRQGIPNGNEDAYARNEVALKMLIAKAAYASGRPSVRISPAFKDWLENNIRAIKCSRDVHAFGDYYEAFIGFFYGAQPENSEGRGGGRK